MTPFRLRKERLADDTLVVVRGGDLDPASIRRDALNAHRRFGEYGISVFAATDDEALDTLAAGRLVRFDVLTLITAGAIRAVGLELRPTFRRPHYTIVLPDLDRDIERLSACENMRWRNPHYPRPEGRP